jgi:hypothetical protein
LRKYGWLSREPPDEMNPLIRKFLLNVVGEFRRVATMNAPVPIPRPEEVSNAPDSTPTTTPKHRLGWLCVVLLVAAVLATLVWNVALGWLAGKAFGLW